MNWSAVKFEELYAEPSRNGTYKPKQFHGSGVKIVNMGEMFAHDIIADQEMKRLAMTDAEMGRFGLVDGDLLFGRRSLVEAGAGKCSLVEGLSEPTTFESSIIRVRVDKDRIRPRFIYYWLKSHFGRGTIRAIVTGTTVKGIKGSVLKDVQILCPPIETQDVIIENLRAYDDLIENNRRRIQLLEQAARLLYKEWFVHLRFPGHEHVKIINGVPEGWEKKLLGEVLLELESGGRPTGGSQEDGIPSVGAENVIGIGKYDYSKEKYVPETYFHSMQKGIIKNRDVLVYKDGANIGRSSYFGDGFPHETCAINEHVFILRASPQVGQNLLYFWVDLDETRQRIANLNANTAQPGVSQNKLKTLNFVVPHESIVSIFNDGVEPIVRQIFLLAKEVQVLITARDLLLPRLMNGEVVV